MSIVDANCLDLFSGSGVFGFESLSRGAAHVVLVDQDLRVNNKLAENAQKLGATHLDIWLESVPSEGLSRRLGAQQFDIVFLDPPFHKTLLKPSISMLCEAGCLAAGAMIYIECERELDILPIIPTGWAALRSKTAGNVAYRLFEAR